jgi:hypothetical protein
MGYDSIEGADGYQAIAKPSDKQPTPRDNKRKLRATTSTTIHERRVMHQARWTQSSLTGRTLAHLVVTSTAQPGVILHVPSTGIATMLLPKRQIGNDTHGDVEIALQRCHIPVLACEPSVPSGKPARERRGSRFLAVHSENRRGSARLTVACRCCIG